MTFNRVDPVAEPAKVFLRHDQRRPDLLQPDLHAAHQSDQPFGIGPFTISSITKVPGGTSDRDQVLDGRAPFVLAIVSQSGRLKDIRESIESQSLFLSIR
jgi:hypothetical protein